MTATTRILGSCLLTIALLLGATAGSAAKPSQCHGKNSACDPAGEEPEPPQPDCIVDSYPWPSFSLTGFPIPQVRFYGFEMRPLPVCVALP